MAYRESRISDLAPTAGGAGRYGPAFAESAVGQSQTCHACLARAKGFCGGLDDRALEQLAFRSTRRTLAQHEALIPGDLAVLTGGFLRAVNHGPDGKRRIVGLTLPGEAIVRDETAEDVTIEAATPVTLCHLQPASVRAALERSHRFRQTLYVQVRAKRDRALRLACAIGARSPEQRIAALLASCTGIMPWQPLPDGGGILTMEFERQDIAALLATTAETVCRALHRMDAAGVIRIRGTRRFEIGDLGRLRREGLLPELDAALAPEAAGAGQAPQSAITVTAAQRDLL